MASVKVALYGDSTEADTRLLPYGVIPAQVIRDWFAANGHDFTIEVAALGGSTAESLVLGRDSIRKGKYCKQTFLDSGAKIIGFRYTAANEYREGHKLARFRNNLETLIAEARACQATVVLSTTSPPNRAQISITKIRFMERAADVIREVAEANRHMTVLCDQWAYAIEDNRLGTLDGLHPNIPSNEYQERRQAAKILVANTLRSSAYG